MAANEAQIEDVRDLHAQGGDYNPNFAAPTQWDQTVGQYNFGPNDPYELYQADMELARVTLAVNPPEGHTSLDLTTITSTVNVGATLTYKGEVYTDISFIFVVEGKPLTVDTLGLITYDAAFNGGMTGTGELIITWKKNPLITTTRTVSYTP